MNFQEGLRAARSRIAVILGLITSISIIVALEHTTIPERAAAPSSVGLLPSSNAPTIAIERTHLLPLPQPSPLTTEEQTYARIAWKYFENNYHEETGLVNSVDGYPASTMWDTGSYLMAVLSAYKLGIITEEIFRKRITSALRALARLPLFDNELPNKSYDTRTATMADYNNVPTERGIGWSAIDIGRLFVPLNIITWQYSSFTPEVRKVLERLRFEHIVRDGVLFGAQVDDSNRTIYLQEGRLGYEEYASKSYGLMGADVSVALRSDDYLKIVRIEGIDVPTDSRSPDRYKAFNYVVSEPYILDGIEFGFDNISREFAYRVYAAQERRASRSGILTAVSEDNIDTVPYFVYNTVYTAGKAWNCLTDKGEDASRFKSLSTKAVFGWHALYRTPYTQRLLNAIQHLYDPDKGWYSGLYEYTGKPNKAITCNTNAIILEALAYKQFGTHLQLLR
ncbi:MAG: DUF3131 domain-containing protein [Bacteroidota bacterium]|nr:DUF3131 domain-containing protein [Candidatus Kapabacteria bacterium]MDW8220307.1 DUF3131 domain-containing protein [Bacteroidota bacterium]